MSDDKEQLIAELPVGKLTGTKKVIKDDNGSETTVLAFKASTGDLHAWEQREFGIDDKIRNAYAERTNTLEKMVSDFATDQLVKNAGEIDAVDVDFGMGNGAENFSVIGRKTSYYPKKNDDGTVERTEKITYGAMKHTTRRIIEKDVRTHHEANQAKIEEALVAVMNKTALK